MSVQHFQSTTPTASLAAFYHPVVTATHTPAAPVQSRFNNATPLPREFQEQLKKINTAKKSLSDAHAGVVEKTVVAAEADLQQEVTEFLKQLANEAPQGAAINYEAVKKALTEISLPDGTAITDTHAAPIVALAIAAHQGSLVSRAGTALSHFAGGVASWVGRVTGATPKTITKEAVGDALQKMKNIKITPANETCTISFKYQGQVFSHTYSPNPFKGESNNPTTVTVSLSDVFDVIDAWDIKGCQGRTLQELIRDGVNVGARLAGSFRDKLNVQPDPENSFNALVEIQSNCCIGADITMNLRSQNPNITTSQANFHVDVNVDVGPGIGMVLGAIAGAIVGACTCYVICGDVRRPAPEVAEAPAPALAGPDIEEGAGAGPVEDPGDGAEGVPTVEVELRRLEQNFDLERAARLVGRLAPLAPSQGRM